MSSDRTPSPTIEMIGKAREWVSLKEIIAIALLVFAIGVAWATLESRIANHENLSYHSGTESLINEKIRVHERVSESVQATHRAEQNARLKRIEEILSEIKETLRRNGMSRRGTRGR